MALKFLQRELFRVKKAEAAASLPIFEVQTHADRVDQWEVTFMYYDEEAARCGCNRVQLLVQFCATDPQVPPKVSVVRPRLTGVGVFSGALCFDRQKMWGDSNTDMEAFLLTLRLHLIYQAQIRIEDPAASTHDGPPTSAASSSSSSPPTAAFTPQERAHGFSHIMRTHWDWELVDIAEDGSAVALPASEAQEQDRQEADRLLQNALAHLSNGHNNVSAALQGISEAIALHPQRSELLYRRAAIFMKLDSHRLALRDLEQAVNLLPPFPGTHSMLEQVRRLRAADNAPAPRTLVVDCAPTRRTATAAPRFFTLEAALIEARDGDVIAVARGTHKVAGVLVTKDVTIKPQPDNAKVYFVGPDGSTNPMEIWGDVVLKGLNFRRSGSGCCIKVLGACALRGGTLVATGEHTMGVLVEGKGSTATIERCDITCDEFAVVVRQKGEITLRRCAVRSANGVIAETAGVLNVHHCRLQSPVIYTDFTSGSIEDSIIFNSRSLGLSFQGRTELILALRNVVRDNQSVGALVCRGARARLEGNVFSRNGRTQVEIQGTTQVEVCNNKIEEGHVNGILVTAKATSPLIEGNTLIAHQNAGISVSEGSTARIVGNTVQLCGASGIFFAGDSEGSIRDNTVSQCGVAGIELEGTRLPTFQGNIVTDCPVGVQAPPGADPRLWADTVLRHNDLDVLHQSPDAPNDGSPAVAPSLREATDKRRGWAYTPKRLGASVEPVEDDERRVTRAMADHLIAGRYPKRRRVATPVPAPA